MKLSLSVCGPGRPRRPLTRALHPCPNSVCRSAGADRDPGRPGDRQSEPRTRVQTRFIGLRGCPGLVRESAPPRGPNLQTDKTSLVSPEAPAKSWYDEGASQLPASYNRSPATTGGPGHNPCWRHQLKSLYDWTVAPVRGNPRRPTNRVWTRVRGSLFRSAGPAGDPPAAPADRQTEFGHGCGARFVGLRGRPGRRPTTRVSWKI